MTEVHNTKERDEGIASVLLAARDEVRNIRHKAGGGGSSLFVVHVLNLGIIYEFQSDLFLLWNVTEGW